MRSWQVKEVAQRILQRQQRHCCLTTTSSGFYQRKGGLLSGQRVQRGGVVVPRPNRPPLVEQVQQQQPEGPQREESLLQSTTTTTTTTTTHEHQQPPRPAAAHTAFPPHIIELSSTEELSLYASDITQLEIFVDQLIDKLPTLSPPNSRMEQRFASHITFLLSVLTNQHGMRGSRLAHKLVQACESSIIASETAATASANAVTEAPPPVIFKSLEQQQVTSITDTRLDEALATSPSHATTTEATYDQPSASPSDQQQQEQHQHPMNAIAAAIAEAKFRTQDIFKIKPTELQNVFDIYQLELFVSQIEQAAAQQSLTLEQVEQHVLPLSKATALKTHNLRGAILTERLLFAIRNNNTNVAVPEALYNRCMIAWGNVRTTDNDDRQRQYRLEKVKHIFNLLRNDPFCKLSRAHYKSLIRVTAQFDAPGAYHILKYELEPLSGVPIILGEQTINNNDNNTNKTVDSTDASSSALVSPILELPDLATYNLVGMAYAKLPPGKAHTTKLWRVVEIYDRVRKLHVKTGAHALDGHSYLALLLAYRQLLRWKDADVMDITNRLEQLFYDQIHPQIRQQQEQERLNPKNYHQDMMDRKRSLDGNEFNNRDLDAVLFPLSMSWAYEILIEAYVKSKQPERGIQLVESMIHGIKGVYQTKARNSTLIILAHNLNTEQRNMLLQRCVLTRNYPRVFFLHEDMEAWASLPAPQPPFVAELVEAMLLHSFAHFRATRNKPTGLTFRIAIKAWMRCRDSHMALTHIDNLMAEMMNVAKVDTWYAIREVHVRLWMTAYSELGRNGQKYTISGTSLFPAEHCERILRLVLPMFNRLNVKASFVAMAIRAWAIQEGDDVDEMERLNRVDALLNSIKADEIPPYPANWVISTCCRNYSQVEAQQRAYQIAASIFMRKDVQLNSRSYELLMEIVYKLRKDETLVVEVFKRASAAGLVSPEAVRILAQLVTTPDDLQTLVRWNEKFASMIVEHRSALLENRIPRAVWLDSVPKEWSLNCDRKKKNESLGGNDDNNDDDDDAHSEEQEETS